MTRLGGTEDDDSEDVFDGLVSVSGEGSALRLTSETAGVEERAFELALDGLAPPVPRPPVRLRAAMVLDAMWQTDTFLLTDADGLALARYAGDGRSAELHGVVSATRGQELCLGTSPGIDLSYVPAVVTEVRVVLEGETHLVQRGATTVTSGGRKYDVIVSDAAVNYDRCTSDSPSGWLDVLVVRRDSTAR